MKKGRLFLSLLTCCVLLGAKNGNAQSWKDILNSSTVKDVVNTLTGNVIKFSDLQGNWNYVEPACKMTIDDKLKELGGTLMSSAFEKKIPTVYTMPAFV